MSDFRKLSDQVWASPQISPEEVKQAADSGFSLIINNRPEGEAAEQAPGDQIELAARTAGMDYVAIPISHAGFSEPQVEAMAKALDAANGRVLAYCRSGTRSTFLWALAKAKGGSDPRSITAAAAEAGYDLSPIRAAIDFYAGQARSE